MEPSERRTGRRLFSKWLEACNGRRLPSLSEVEADADQEVLEHSFVIDVTPGPSSYRFSRFGAALRDMVGEDYTGRRVAGLPPSIAGSAMDICHSAVAAAKPVGRSEELVQMFGQMLCFRLIVLPVANETQRVDALVGTVGYRARSMAREAQAAAARGA